MLALTGQLEDAIEACARGVAAAPDPTGSALAGSHLGYAHLARRDTARAVPLLTEAVAQLDRLRMARSLGRVTGWLGEAQLWAGEVERARRFGARALELTTAARHPYGVGEAQRLLARVTQSSGNLDEAAEKLRDAVLTFESIEARFEVARTRLLLGDVLANRGDRDAAETETRAAHVLFDQLGVPAR